MWSIELCDSQPALLQISLKLQTFYVKTLTVEKSKKLTLNKLDFGIWGPNNFKGKAEIDEAVSLKETLFRTFEWPKKVRQSLAKIEGDLLIALGLKEFGGAQFAYRRAMNLENFRFCTHG